MARGSYLASRRSTDRYFFNPPYPDFESYYEERWRHLPSFSDQQILEALISHQRARLPKLASSRTACRAVARFLGVTIARVGAVYDKDLQDELKSKGERGRPSRTT
jgi:hypothetical protein